MSTSQVLSLINYIADCLLNQFTSLIVFLFVRMQVNLRRLGSIYHLLIETVLLSWLSEGVAVVVLLIDGLWLSLLMMHMTTWTLIILIYIKLYNISVNWTLLLNNWKVLMTRIMCFEVRITSSRARIIYKLMSQTLFWEIRWLRWVLIINRKGASHLLWASWKIFLHYDIALIWSSLCWITGNLFWVNLIVTHLATFSWVSKLSNIYHWTFIRSYLMWKLMITMMSK